MQKKTTYTFAAEDILSAVCGTYGIDPDKVKSFITYDSNTDTHIDINEKQYSDFLSFVIEVES